MRFTLFSLALLLLLSAPHAHAATKDCKEGVKATIEGEVREMSDAGNRIWLYVDDYSWDCAHIYVVVTRAQAKPCMAHGHARATGTLTRKDKHNMEGFWSLTDESAGKGPRMTKTFSCTGPGDAQGNAQPQSKSQ